MLCTCTRIIIKGIKRILVIIESCESARELAMDDHGFDGPGVNSLSKPKRCEMHIASMELNSWSSPSHLDGKKKH